MGILLGVVAQGFLEFLARYLMGLKAVDNAVKMWHFVALGVVVMNLPAFLKRKQVDREIL